MGHVLFGFVVIEVLPDPRPNEKRGQPVADGFARNRAVAWLYSWHKPVRAQG